MKVGYTTLFDFNYGSALQAYATRCFFEDRFGECDLFSQRIGYGRIGRLLQYGLQTLDVCLRSPKDAPSLIRASLTPSGAALNITKESEKKIKSFISSSLQPRYYTLREMKELAEKDTFHAFLSGSDQVWNGARTRGYDAFFLRFAPAGKRIAWAPSFGGDTVSDWNKKRYRKYIREYAHLSAREESGAELIRALTGRDATVLADPVMLLERESWLRLIEKEASVVIPQNAVLAFFLDKPSSKTVDRIDRFASENGKKVISVGYTYSLFAQKGWQHFDGNPADFLSAIQHADCVFTDSYHATVFSTILERPFFVFPRNYQGRQDQSTRVTLLLKRIGLSDRYDASDFTAEQPDFKTARPYFESGRAEAEHYLRTALGLGADEQKPHTPYRSEKDCFSCGACAAACPKQCIQMVKSDRGFYRPVIDEAICVNCGLCETCCPTGVTQDSGFSQKAYLALTDDKPLYQKSSSGGLFAALAKQHLAAGGAVYGSAMVCQTGQSPRCQHIRITTLEELPQIQGSKYVKSDTTGIFPLVKQDLAEGKKVLFSGTSCQVSALQHYLRRKDNNLTTVDLVCHGVPPQDLLDDYRAYLEKKHHFKIEHIAFRNKEITRSGQPLLPFLFRAEGKAGDLDRTLSIPMRESAYYRLYMTHTGYMDCCYRCPFATHRKPADLTLGDYDVHGSEVLHSCVLVNTEKGAEAFGKLSLAVKKEVPLQDAIASHDNLYQPSVADAAGVRMLSTYRKGGFSALQRKLNFRNRVITVLKKIKK